VAEQVERLAHHALRGEVWEKAVAYCRQAGANAMARAANREAAAHLDQALSALVHLPEDASTLAEAIDLRIELRHALWPLGEVRRIVDSLQRAESLAETLGDQRRLARVLNTQGYNFCMLGDPDRVVAPNRRALAIATGLGDFALEATANFALGQAYYGLGDYRGATGFFKSTLASLHGERIRTLRDCRSHLRPGQVAASAVPG
jgi:tetratricopeptide (TPR) repeat protein